MPYPPSTNAGDPSAPWNQPAEIECVECGGIWAENGHKPISNRIYVCHNCQSEFEVDTTDTAPDKCHNCGDPDIEQLPCPHKGQTQTEYEEMLKAEQAEMKMDETRIADNK